jgi:hypothetical protein
MRGCGKGLDIMPFNTLLFGFGLLLVTSGTDGKVSSTAPPQMTASCAVTRPNGVVAGGGEKDSNSYGNGQVSVGPFGLWPDGTVVFKPGGAGFVTRDGSLGMKFGWRRGVPGRLEIEGRRLDEAASPLRAEVPNGYGDLGCQATYVIFPTPGCWEVTGRVGRASVTFVTRVVRIGNGPAWRRDVP